MRQSNLTPQSSPRKLVMPPNKSSALIRVVPVIGLSLLLGCLWFGCSFLMPRRITSPREALFRSLPPSEMVDDGSVGSFREALRNSLEALSKLPLGAKKSFGSDEVPVSEQIAALQMLDNWVRDWGFSSRFWDHLAAEFEFYQPATSEVLFTGYYEATLHGSRRPSADFQVPLYGVPTDLVRLPPDEKVALDDGTRTDRGRRLANGEIVPYHTRNEILFGKALSGKGAELLWLDSVIDLVFLQIQGSGVVFLDDGSVVRVNFADRNGYGYRPIGRFLVERGIFTSAEMSMQKIRGYLRENPEMTEEMLSYDPSYVFFRQVERGPMGSIGVPVVPYRSLAMDRSLFPDGALVYVDLVLADGKRMRRLAFLHDSGGAIKGPGRVDLFVGRGPAAEEFAGSLRANGSFYFLTKRRAT